MTKTTGISRLLANPAWKTAYGGVLIAWGLALMLKGSAWAAGVALVAGGVWLFVLGIFHGTATLRRGGAQNMDKNERPGEETR